MRSPNGYALSRSPHLADLGKFGGNRADEITDCCHGVIAAMTLSQELRLLYDSLRVDGKPLQVRDQGGSFQTEPRGCAIGSADAST